MVAQRRQLSESQLSCEAMSETNKYSFETFLQHIHPLQYESFPALLPAVGHIWWLWAWRERQLRNKATIARQPSTLLWTLVSRGTFGRNAQGKCSSFNIWSWLVTNNKVLPYRLLEQYSTRPWCPSYLRFQSPMRKKKLNDKEQRFPEKCSPQPRWPLWSNEFDEWLSKWFEK